MHSYLFLVQLLYCVLLCCTSEMIVIYVALEAHRPKLSVGCLSDQRVQVNDLANEFRTPLGSCSWRSWGGEGSSVLLLAGSGSCPSHLCSSVLFLFTAAVGPERLFAEVFPALVCVLWQTPRSNGNAPLEPKVSLWGCGGSSHMRGCSEGTGHSRGVWC